uniref:Uncharacterized protein n=1 Tax=Ixodes ricinus TaxID=34613 RepID=A0A6B0V339_IXORI
MPRLSVALVVSPADSVHVARPRLVQSCHTKLWCRSIKSQTIRRQHWRCCRCCRGGLLGQLYQRSKSHVLPAAADSYKQRLFVEHERLSPQRTDVGHSQEGIHVLESHGPRDDGRRRSRVLGRESSSGAGRSWGSRRAGRTGRSRQDLPSPRADAIGRVHPLADSGRSGWSRQSLLPLWSTDVSVGGASAKADWARGSRWTTLSLITLVPWESHRAPLSGRSNGPS